MFGLRFAAVFLAVALTALPARAADLDLATTTNDFVEFLTFAGSAPLGPVDRERVAAQTKLALAANSAALAKDDAQIRKLLGALPKAQAWQRADARETLRLNAELLPANEPLRQMLDRTDPVVVFDRAHKRVMTEGTLAAWQRAYTWMAGLLSLPGPGPSFIADERAYLKNALCRAARHQSRSARARRAELPGDGFGGRARRTSKARTVYPRDPSRGARNRHLRADSG